MPKNTDDAMAAGTMVDVFLDGNYIGATADCAGLVSEIRRSRRGNQLSEQVNVCYYPQFGEIRVFSDSGRVRRPAIVVENGRSRLTDDVASKIRKGQIA